MWSNKLFLFWCLILLVKNTLAAREQYRGSDYSHAPLKHRLPLDTYVDDEEEPVDHYKKPQAHVELEYFSDTGVLAENGTRKADHGERELNTDEDDTDFLKKNNKNGKRKGGEQSVIHGVSVSNEYPTTMIPVLTTSRESRGFDFIPVNVIREDSKDAYNLPFVDRHFDDIGDVSLVPAGTSSRIQVKKGPNGKDYEYEYVYYYYDEEDEGKASQDAKTTVAPSRRGGNGNSNSNRNKYNNNIERSSTSAPEAVSNEVIPNRHSHQSRGRQLVEATDDVSEERLPTNTRFPPRSRSSHNTGTTEATRARGNRPRPSLELVDSSSFRTHQEGPEFPQNLPKGPLRFLGVTPNEENGDRKKQSGRGRPQRLQEETYDEASKKYTSQEQFNQQSEVEVEGPRGSIKSRIPGEDIDDLPQGDIGGSSTAGSDYPPDRPVSEESEGELMTTTTESITTEYPSAMEKVALDLYAFLQQGQNNLVDGSSTLDTSDSEESTDSPVTPDEIEATTIDDAQITTELSGSTQEDLTTLTPSTSTTTSTTTTSTTTTTTTTEAPTTTTTTEEPHHLPGLGRGKFRRPGGLNLPGSSRNRLNKQNGNQSGTESSSPAPEASTQRTRGRYGGNGGSSGGFKRSRPHQKTESSNEEQQVVEKESHSEFKPSSSRGRFRGSGSGSRTGQSNGGSSASSTAAPTGSGSGSGSSSSASAPSSPFGNSRPSFNKLNINRRRGRPTSGGTSTGSTVAAGTTAATEDEVQSSASTEATVASTKAPRNRLPGHTRPHALKPGARVNPLKARLGQVSTTTQGSTAGSTASPLSSGSTGNGSAAQQTEVSDEDPAGEGTEEETREAPAETSPPARSTTQNPLNRLRNRTRLLPGGNPPKTLSTTAKPASGVSLPARRSPLLPRRRTTEARVSTTEAPESIAVSEEDEENSQSAESAEHVTEALISETSTAASSKHEETRTLGGLYAPRRRIAPRRPGLSLPSRD